jgi:hypothetical protein
LKTNYLLRVFLSENDWENRNKKKRNGRNQSKNPGKISLHEILLFFLGRGKFDLGLNGQSRLQSYPSCAGQQSTVEIPFKRHTAQKSRLTSADI